MKVKLEHICMNNDLLVNSYEEKKKDKLLNENKSSE